MGKGGVRLTKFFFEKGREAGILTHYVDADVNNATMTVLPATVVGKGLEVICRFRAVGSFRRRYGDYCTEGQPLDAFVEVTLKDDERGDPPITKDALEMLGLLSNDEYEELKDLTQRIARIVRDELAKKGMELYDIKFEFGRSKKGNVMLIDEISGGNMRVYRNGKQVGPLDIVRFMLD
jgi:phosphoribosylaminoimidazole-succinocarboxamide synthase